MVKKIVRTRGAKAIREVIVTAREDVACYGTSRVSYNPYRFVNFVSMSRLEYFQHELYNMLYVKYLNERLDALSAADSSKLMEAERFHRSGEIERRFCKIEKELNELREEVAFVKKV